MCFTKISLLSIILFLSSCSKEDGNNCGGEDKEKVTGLSIANYDNFYKYYQLVGNGTISYSALYGTKANKSFYSMKTEIGDYCIKEPILVYATVELKSVTPEITDTLVIYEYNTGGVFFSKITQAVPQSTSLYNIDAPFIVKEEGTRTGFINYIYFPNQGSQASDSAYFFSHLKNAFLGSKYKGI
ncbi:MAG TPA: hypothetical protein VK590_15160 [Saprospiraceae bacterium]|nr:hypothetical protein [Saprospiraceae bacterium]